MGKSLLALLTLKTFRVSTTCFTAIITGVDITRSRRRLHASRIKIAYPHQALSFAVGKENQRNDDHIIAKTI